MIVDVLGGIGLFLLGMLLLTDGLKSVAGDTLRRGLSRLVRGPLTGVATGATATALVQSSSATTLTTIGLVSAGLLTFTQSVSVIFGANIGTTSTGWIVSQLGFKVSISAVAMPMIFIGVFMRLLLRRRLGGPGFALAGFGLIFVGLGVLQDGMSELATAIDPADLPGAQGGVGGLALLVFVGVLMTVVMQSSSAAVATTLAALYAETISINQAAALVIGQNIGTTITAVIASVGASVPARRTALAHILFNVFTGAVAIALLVLFGQRLTAMVPAGNRDAALTAVAGFHTAFNLLGVVLLLPVVKPFCWLIARLVPYGESTLTRFLDLSVVNVSPVAVDAARRTLIEIMEAMVNAVEPALARGGRSSSAVQRLQIADDALSETERFLSRLTGEQQSQRQTDRLRSVLHAADHVMRLSEVCREPWPARAGWNDALVQQVNDDLQAALLELRTWFAQTDAAAPTEALRRASETIAEHRRQTRAALLDATASGQRTAAQTLALLDAIRLVDQIAYHLWRATWHLQPAPAVESQPIAAAPS